MDTSDPVSNIKVTREPCIRAWMKGRAPDNLVVVVPPAVSGGRLHWGFGRGGGLVGVDAGGTLLANWDGRETKGRKLWGSWGDWVNSLSFFCGKVKEHKVIKIFLL